MEIASRTGVFKPIELVTLDEVLGDFLRDPWGDNYHCYTHADEVGVGGFVCYGPNTMTDRTWDLYWIAVDPERHGRGIGTELLRFAEDDVRKLGGRLILIETSSLPTYDNTRHFYQRHGYREVAVVPDFYADGDSLHLYHKRMEGRNR
jgi:ribosomal protein S18 acetylase RimI-like enzyme